MKIEELTGCFDSITPTKEQKEKMLAGILGAKEEVPVKIVKFNRYKIASIAAVIAVGVFVAVYSNIGKNIVPQVDIKQNIEKSDVSTYAVADVQKKTVQEPLDNNVKPKVYSDVVPPAAEVLPSMEDSSLTDDLNKEYTELNDAEKAEDVPSVAMYNNENDTRVAPTPENSEEFVESDETYNGGGGGGASGGGSSYESAEYTNLTITEVMNHEVYSPLIPVVYADKFNFYNAALYSNRLKVVFKNINGNYMSLSVFKDGDYNFYEQFLTLDEIKNIDSDGYMNFAVKCGDYYIVYNVESHNPSAVYDMVVSSEYFNN